MDDVDEKSVRPAEHAVSSDNCPVRKRHNKPDGAENERRVRQLVRGMLSSGYRPHQILVTFDHGDQPIVQAELAEHFLSRKQNG